MMCLCGDASWTDCVTAASTALGALGTVVTAGIAWYVAATWQHNLRQTTKHDIATKVLEEARLFRYLFYDARSPWYDAAEFPAEYHSMPADQRSPAVEGRAWTAVYQKRWDLLQPQMLVLAKLRARAGAALGDPIADAIEQLAKKGRELHGFFQEAVGYKREGAELVTLYPDQGWVARVKASVKADQDRADSYSREFEERFSALEALVKPHMHVIAMRNYLWNLTDSHHPECESL